MLNIKTIVQKNKLYQKSMMLIVMMIMMMTMIMIMTLARLLVIVLMPLTNPVMVLAEEVEEEEEEQEDKVIAENARNGRWQVLNEAASGTSDSKQFGQDWQWKSN